MRLIYQKQKQLSILKIVEKYSLKRIIEDFLIEKDKITIPKIEFSLFLQETGKMISLGVKDLLNSCTDKVMEGMFNYQTGIEVKKLRPTLAVLFL